MTVNGIIAEYNPFHNGHAYHILRSKELTGADFTIVVMSGDFVQRGAPAILDKHLRTRMALEGGADLVIEIPTVYALSCAEQFAFGGVSILNSLGVTDCLCFGSETDDLVQLQTLSNALSEETDEVCDAIKLSLQNGLSYPKAKINALFKSHPEYKVFAEILSSPNNILALEYLQTLKKLKSTIQPFPISRIGDAYHSTKSTSVYSSATAIRKILLTSDQLDPLKELLPDASFRIISDQAKENALLTANDFSSLLLYKLLLQTEKGYDSFQDINTDLSDRIRKHLFEFDSFKGFCDTLKTKNLTYARIGRGLCNILLDLPSLEHFDSPKYARVLGFKESAKPLLTKIKKNSSIPLVTKYADAKNYLPQDALQMLDIDLKCAHIYETVLSGKTGRLPRNETRLPICKL